MGKQADPLSHIKINSPCNSDWNSMTGNEQVRFCDHCQLSVHHLSSMTQKEVLRLVIRSQGRLCVRYRPGPDGGIETASLPARLHQIKRRATRIAAGAFTAALSLSSTTAAAQSGSPSRALSASGTEIITLNETARACVLADQGSTITGHVLDPQGAAVMDSRLTLVNEQTGIEWTIFSDEEGGYRFYLLEAGTYTLKVEQAGFKTTIIEHITLNGSDVQEINPTLNVGEYLTGAVVVTTPSSPLVKAAMDNDMAALKELLDTGADVNAIDENYNSTALMVAVAQGNLEIVQALLWAGADVEATDSNGQTALMNLSERTGVEIIKALLAAGAETDAQDDDGDTALMLVAAMSNLDVLKALLAAEAPVNTKNDKGETALIVAAEKDIIENVKALIEGGADVYERDEEGDTVLTRARQNKNRRMIKLLRTYGAIEYIQ